MTEQPNREVILLNAALELPASQRAACLDQACAGDAALRRQVEALLQAHEQAGDFLQAPPTGFDFKRSTTINLPTTEKSGDKIGRYKLLQQIGEGGCGVVYMAEQEEPVRRRVALKIIKLGMDTKQVIARFEAERQALALMDHPNIARIFDAGVTGALVAAGVSPAVEPGFQPGGQDVDDSKGAGISEVGPSAGADPGGRMPPSTAGGTPAATLSAGRPYFVMELVRGVKITEFCDEHQVSTEDRLKLFIQVCQAIQHAHQKGVIHRDIKPSNILVTVNDGVPVPKVIDFGIAKATQGRLTDQTLFTAFEQFIGTPAYMSPEQAVMTSLDVDTRSDIYSLGVLLYELLTGRTPFDTKDLLQSGFDEMRRTIREVEPVKPSTRLTHEFTAAKRSTDFRSAPAVAGPISNRQARESSDAVGSAGGPQAGSAATQQIGNLRHAHSPVQLKHLIQALRGDLDWIVMKCLEKDRTRRYETANGLAADLQRHLRNEPVTARPPSNLDRIHKWVRRNRLIFAAASAIAVATFLALVILVISTARITRERNQKDIALQEKNSALDAAQASERRAREELFVSLRSQAQARRFSRQMGQRLESLAALAEAARIHVDAELRDEAIAAMALPDVRRGPKWQVGRTNCVALACDAMGQRYAMLDYQGVLTVRGIEDNREIHRFETGPTDADRYTSLTFSPDGRFLAKTGDGQRPELWLLESGEPVLQDAPAELSGPSFSANRRWVALAGVREVRCFDLATGREANRWSTAGRLHALQFHPADTRIAVGYKSGPYVSIYDATNGREIAQLEVGLGSRMVVNWHPDGRHLAVGSTALGIQIWDVEAKRRVATLEGHANEVDFLSFHPSGQWLASWSWDGVMQLWDPATGRAAMQIPLLANLQFSRDGRWLGFFWASEDYVQLLEFVSPQEYFTLQHNFGASRLEHHACAVTPDDRLLAVAMDDGVRLWDLPNRREVARLPAGLTESVLFESDGQALWTCSEETGLQRWPIRLSDTNATELLIGPPRRIELPFAPVRISSASTGNKLAVVSEIAGQATLLDLAAQVPSGVTVRQPMASYVALSPDTKWWAISGWHSDRTQLWNVESGELVRDWVAGLQTRVAFTPDSRELILARGSEFQFLQVETLETSRRLRREIGLYAGDVVFSPNGKLMALEMAPAVIQLKEVSTGRTVAQLEDPFGDRSNAISFTRDGTKLIVASTYSSVVHVWDLRAIRARLKPMGLDWDWPEFPPASAFEGNRPSPSRSVLKLQVIRAATQ